MQMPATENGRRLQGGADLFHSLPERVVQRRVHSSNSHHNQMRQHVQIADSCLCSHCVGGKSRGVVLQERAMYVLTTGVHPADHERVSAQRLDTLKRHCEADTIDEKVQALRDEFTERCIHKWTRGKQHRNIDCDSVNFNGGAKSKIKAAIRAFKDTKAFWIALQAVQRHIARRGVVDTCPRCGHALAPMRKSAKIGPAKSVTVTDKLRVVVNATGKACYMNDDRFTWNGTKSNGNGAGPQTGNLGNSPTAWHKQQMYN